MSWTSFLAEFLALQQLQNDHQDINGWVSDHKVQLQLTYSKLPLDFPLHTMGMRILPLYMKAISFQSKASVVCSVTTAIVIDFCLKKLCVFSQHIGKKANEYLNSTEQITRNWNVSLVSMLITPWEIT